MKARYCGQCGVEHDPDVTTCPGCGKALSPTDVESTAPAVATQDLEKAPRRRMRASLDVFAALGFVAFAVAGLVLWRDFLPPSGPSMAYEGPSAAQYDSLVTTALSDYAVNNLTADSAPKQQVVNGWVAKDLLTIVAKENGDVLRGIQALGVQNEALLTATPRPDERIPALLLLGVLTLCWSGLLSTLRARVT